MSRNTTRFFKEHSLTLVLFGLFLAFLIGQSITGFHHENDERTQHQLPVYSFGQYVTSGSFVEATFENWESEFLQMAALVLLTIFLRQKGAADSKKLRGKEKTDTSSRYSIIQAHSWQQYTRAAGHLLYDNSLSIALLFLFLLSFLLHAFGGVEAYNEEIYMHGGSYLDVWQYMATTQFWFESFQNWQSEFLSVAVLLVLSIYLRQRGSPESKPVEAPNAATGR